MPESSAEPVCRVLGARLLQSKWKPVIMVPLSLQTQRALKNAVARKGGQGNLVCSTAALSAFCLAQSHSGRYKGPAWAARKETPATLPLACVLSGLSARYRVKMGEASGDKHAPIRRIAASWVRWVETLGEA